MRSVWAAAASLAALTFVGTTLTVIAQTIKSAADGVYTDAQAARGEAAYKAECAICHGSTLEGGLGPPLAGASFLGAWDKRPLVEAVDKIQHTMPATRPGTLSRAQATDLVAYLLKANAFRAASAELPADDSLKQIALIAPAGAAPATAAPTGAVASLLSGRPPANLAQMMRGILFPSSNLIFNVQGNDPGVQKQGWQPSAGSAFSWVDWGAGIYTGWELVDYAALAIAESAPLLLTPGRRCENGRPVPVNDPQWIKFTLGMAEVGREVYKVSQTRNHEAVSEATNLIADACLACHEVYRDKPGGTTADPSNKAARCVL
jgi:mono/diheme cytochrome c family protein